jgi:hypothetical protein
MDQLILSTDQIRTVVAAIGDVPVCDTTGNFLGYLHRNPFTPEEVAQAMKARNSAGPWRTSAQVQERLRSLERS